MMSTILIENFYSFFSWSLLLLLIIFYFSLRKVARNTLRHKRKLKLLQLRDELRFQVAIGNLKEDTYIFKHFDDLCNTVISKIDDFSIYKMYKAIDSKKYKEFSKKKSNTSEYTFKQLEKQSPEVKQVALNIYKEIGFILLWQSKLFLSLTLAIYANTLLRKFAKKTISSLLIGLAPEEWIIYTSRTRQIVQRMEHRNSAIA